jgi:hypothetical protein
LAEDKQGRGICGKDGTGKNCAALKVSLTIQLL